MDVHRKQADQSYVEAVRCCENVGPSLNLVQVNVVAFCQEPVCAHTRFLVASSSSTQSS